MRHWLQLAIRNWRVRPGRSLAVVIAIALGVGTVITVTSIFASVEATIGEQIVDNWLGRSHLSVESPAGHWGNVDGNFAEQVAKVDGIDKVAIRLKRRMGLMTSVKPSQLPSDAYMWTEGRLDVDVVGIDPRGEYDFRDFSKVEGKQIKPNDRGVVILDKNMAQDLGIAIGDTITAESHLDGPTIDLKVIGLFPARRVAIFQKPTIYVHLADLQQVKREPGKVTIIDCMMVDPQPDELEACAAGVRELVKEQGLNYQVTTATAKLNQLMQAQNVTHLFLLLVAFVALLTAFFIILTTMSMGMMERIGLLGMMRCIGMTRTQMVALVFAEVLPLGIIGVLLGIPTGIGLTELGVAVVPHVDAFVQEIVISTWGVCVAVVGGLITTLAAVGGLLVPACRVSPLQAANPQTQASSVRVVIGAAVVGILLLVAHWAMIEKVQPESWFNPIVAFCGVATIYGGYVLIAPSLVLLVGTLVINFVAPLFGIRRKLAQDQVGRAPWRSAGVCWMLMVGLSLIVYFVVRGESITRAWDFPSRLAGTFVWTSQPMERAKLEEVKAIPGVGDITPINDIICKVQPNRKTFLSLFTSQSVFAAGDPETFLSMAKLEFLQGNLEDAEAKLRKGGYLLLPPEASRSFGYNLGDKVPVTIADKTVEFEVAGVVKSPAMDIAVSYFQADSYMMLASACSVLGTLQDLERCFDITTISMFLMNIDLPVTPPPAEFRSDEPPKVSVKWAAGKLEEWLPKMPLQSDRLSRFLPELTAFSKGETRTVSQEAWKELRRIRHALSPAVDQWDEIDPDARWEIFRENLVIRQVTTVIDRPRAMTGSLRRLKKEIDKDIRKATLVISSIPLLSLLVASLGVANLMMVNVASRSRQIAVLRSVGSTKGQIARLVLAEAFVLGVLGSGVGLLLGLQSAYSTQELVGRLIGVDVPFVVPWFRVVVAIVSTCVICLLAGIIPALRASRNNIIDALQTV